MRTNYENLSTFEICAVWVAAIGLVLIGLQIYITLPAHSQAQVSDVFQMFDMHESFTHLVTATGFALGGMQSFYDDFDVAFTQLFSYPDSVGTTTMKLASAIGNYSDSFAQTYAYNNQQLNKNNLGAVLGAYITNQQTQVMAPVIKATPKYFNKQYYYHAPGMVEKIIR